MNKRGNKLIKFISVIMASIMMLLMMFSNFKDTHKKVVAEGETIYFDLSAGNVSIGTTYTGYVYQLNEETGTYEENTVSGTHNSNNVYHIYQTKNDKVSWSTELTKEVEADKVDVEKYAIAWDAIAVEEGRSASTNKITVTAVKNTTTNIILDNIWSSAQSQTRGGLDFNVGSVQNCDLNITLKGDNRLQRIFYSNKSSTNGSSLSFNSIEGGTSSEGSLLVVGNQKPVVGNGAYRTYYNNAWVDKNVPYSHWQSVIGGNDDGSTENAYGLIFNGGTVYAGSTKWENCTAIGGGGNGETTVTINGGTVYAISSSTGTAIGGGIAHQSYGGEGYVTINGGNVYAYNFGAPYAETLYSSERTLMIRDFGGAEFIPGTAIGGGSSVKSTGAAGKVTINGGNVYAESLGGAGIGGGNTVQNTGGSTTIEINGGTVRALSSHKVLDTIIDDLGQSITTIVESGTGIGGGSSEKSNGGTANVTINGGKIITNGIGGGGTIKGNGGSANVIINGGTTKADSIGGGFSTTNGYADGNVKVLGGSINTTMAAIPVNGEGEMVYMTRIALYKDDEIVTGVHVDELYGENLGAFASSSEQYKGLWDVQPDENGMLYFYLPDGSIITGAKDRTGYVYTASEELDEQIAVKEVGKLITSSVKEHYMINVIPASYYELYNDKDMYDAFSGIRFVDRGSTFTFYVKINKDKNGNYYDVVPYFTFTDSNGNKSFVAGSMTPVDGEEGLYSISITPSSDTQITFETYDEGDKHFTFDLTNGDIKITAGENGAIEIEQNGYVLSGYTGQVYLTSGGYPTSNRVIVNAPGTEVDMVVSKLIVSSAEAPIDVQSGTLNVTSTESDDYIISTQGPAITVAEDATLCLRTSGMASLKVIGAEGSSAIKGQGIAIIEDEGGFLVLNEETNDAVPQLSVGTYEYKSTSSGEMPYTAELYDGRFTFTLIGYIKGNVLYGVDDTLDGNRENFSARGISESFTNAISENGYVNEKGEYVVTLKTKDANAIGSPVLKVETGETVSADNYNWNPIVDGNGVTSSGTLTIKGSAFVDGNITIFAASKGALPYASYDYEGVYDTREHDIFISVFDTERFKIFYTVDEVVYASWTGDEVIKELSVEEWANPLFTDVGEYIVYWYIYDTMTGEDHFGSVRGHNSVIIKKGTNAWDNTLVCPDVVLGNYPNPSISSKWGTPIYEYYSRSEVDGQYVYTKIDDESYVNNEGIYYVKAYVPGTSNYDLIETNYYIRFRVFKTNVFTSPISSLTKVNGAETNLMIPVNGSFSIYYQFNSTSDMSLKIVSSQSYAGTVIQGGIEIVMIDFKDDGTARYYYYVVKDSDIKVENPYELIIDLTSFKAMNGNDENYALPVTQEKTNLQFAIQIPEDNIERDIISVYLMNDITASEVFDKVSIDITTDGVESEIEFAPAGSEYANEVDLEFSISSNDATTKSKIVSFVVTKAGEKYPLHDTTISLNGNIKPSIVIGNRVVFDLGSGSADNMTYVLELGNIESGTYEIFGYIDLVDKENYDYLYLNSSGVEKTYVTVEVKDKINAQMDVYEKDFQRIIDSKDDMLLNLQLSTNDLVNGIEVSYTRKVNGVYGNYTSILEVSPIAPTEGTIAKQLVQIDLSSFNNLVDGTYRIKFVQGTTVCYYNIIVDLQ